MVILTTSDSISIFPLLWITVFQSTSPSGPVGANSGKSVGIDKLLKDVEGCLDPSKVVVSSYLYNIASRISSSDVNLSSSFLQKVRDSIAKKHRDWLVKTGDDHGIPVIKIEILGPNNEPEFEVTIKVISLRYDMTIVPEDINDIFSGVTDDPIKTFIDFVNKLKKEYGPKFLPPVEENYDTQPDMGTRDIYEQFTKKKLPYSGYDP